jgi:hypothetical protein
MTALAPDKTVDCHQPLRWHNHILFSFPHCPRDSFLDLGFFRTRDPFPGPGITALDPELLYCTREIFTGPGIPFLSFPPCSPRIGLVSQAQDSWWGGGGGGGPRCRRSSLVKSHPPQPLYPPRPPYDPVLD